MPSFRPTQGITHSPIGCLPESKTQLQNTSFTHGRRHWMHLTRLSLALLCAYQSPSWAQQAAEAPVVKPAETKEAPKADVKVEKKDPKAAKPDAVQKVEISGAKGYDERRQDTASKIVVTQEEILRYGDTSIGDVLKRLPGVTIGGVQGRGGRGSVSWFGQWLYPDFIEWRTQPAGVFAGFNLT